MQKERDRYAPVALPRNAPVGTGFHHGFESCTTPGREKLRFINGAFGNPAQRGGVFPILVIHANEPLRGGAEDDWRLVPPAVRVAVGDALHFEQASPGFEFLQDQRIGFPDRLAGQRRDREGGGVGEKPAIVADRVIDRQAIDLADLVVVGTMRRCSMYEAGTGFKGNVLAADDGYIAFLEGVSE